MKGKVRNFVNEYKKEIALGASAAVGLITGYKLGVRVSDVAYKRALEKVFAVKPEVYPLIMDAVKEINHK